MAPLVAPGVVRYTIHETYAGRDIANIIDMFVETTGSIEDRALAAFTVAGDVLNNWADHMLDYQSNNVTFDRVSWVDLDELDGSTGERTSTSDNVLPLAGSGSETPMPGNVAILFTKVAPGGGRSTRNGRTYLTGVSEGFTGDADPNVLLSAALSGLTTAGGEFLSGVNDAGGGIGRNMVVVHTRNAGTPTNPNIVYQSQSAVTAFTPQATLATQRRRLRG